MKVPSKDFHYDGDFEAGLRTGYGVEHIGKEVTYRGDFKRNLKDGDGCLMTPDYFFEGGFKKNRFDGFGKCVWKDLREYEGQWQAGLKHGFGEFKWPDGRVFKGSLASLRLLQRRKKIRRRPALQGRNTHQQGHISRWETHRREKASKQVLEDRHGYVQRLTV